MVERFAASYTGKLYRGEDGELYEVLSVFHDRAYEDGPFAVVRNKRTGQLLCPTPPLSLPKKLEPLLVDYFKKANPDSPYVQHLDQMMQRQQEQQRLLVQQQQQLMLQQASRTVPAAAVAAAAPAQPISSMLVPPVQKPPAAAPVAVDVRQAGGTTAAPASSSSSSEANPAAAPARPVIRHRLLLDPKPQPPPPAPPSAQPAPSTSAEPRVEGLTLEELKADFVVLSNFLALEGPTRLLPMTAAHPVDVVQLATRLGLSGTPVPSSVPERRLDPVQVARAMRLNPEWAQQARQAALLDRMERCRTTHRPMPERAPTKVLSWLVDRIDTPQS